MEKRRLGKDGPALSVVGYGTWLSTLAATQTSQPNDEQSCIDAIRTALDLGVNWIDSAPAYGFGAAERCAGAALDGYRRDEVFLATKCGIVWDHEKNLQVNLHPQSVRSELHQSLTRLRTDHVDLYQIHLPDPAIPIEDTWGELVRLKEEGKVRYLGVCNFDLALLRRCLAIHPVQALQLPYSLAYRDIQEDFLPFCRRHAIGLLVYSPVQLRYFLDRVAPVSRDSGHWLSRITSIRPPRFSQILALIEQIKPIADRHGYSIGQLALAWVLTFGTITAAITGARDPSRVRQSIEAAAWQPSSQELAEIGEAIAETIGL